MADFLRQTVSGREEGGVPFAHGLYVIGIPFLTALMIRIYMYTGGRYEDQKSADVPVRGDYLRG